MWFSLILPKLCRLGAIVSLRQGRELRQRDIQNPDQLLARASPLRAADSGVDPGPAVSRDGDLDQSKPTSLTSQEHCSGGVLRSGHLGLLEGLFHWLPNATQSHNEHLSLCIYRAVQVLRTENSVEEKNISFGGKAPRVSVCSLLVCCVTLEKAFTSLGFSERVFLQS